MLNIYYKTNLRRVRKGAAIQLSKRRQRTLEEDSGNGAQILSKLSRM